MFTIWYFLFGFILYVMRAKYCYGKVNVEEFLWALVVGVVLPLVIGVENIWYLIVGVFIVMVPILWEVVTCKHSDLLQKELF